MSSPCWPPSKISADAFVAAFGAVYEHSRWVAEKLVADGLSPADDTADAIAARMARIVDLSGREAQLELLRAHPELVGRLKVGEELTQESRREQAGARLDACTPDEIRRFHALNDRYRSAFGFPFIIAVTGLSRADILENFEARVGNDVETEFATALQQVHRIARLRIEKLAEAAHAAP